MRKLVVFFLILTSATQLISEESGSNYYNISKLLEEDRGLSDRMTVLKIGQNNKLTINQYNNIIRNYYIPQSRITKATLSNVLLPISTGSYLVGDIAGQRVSSIGEFASIAIMVSGIIARSLQPEEEHHGPNDRMNITFFGAFIFAGFKVYGYFRPGYYSRKYNKNLLGGLNNSSGH